MRPYRQARIWAYLREHPGATPRAIGVALDITLKSSVRKALARMVEDGSARVEGGATWRRKFYALGDSPPIDTREGLFAADGPMTAQRRLHWRENLEKAYAATGRTGVHVRRPDVARLNASCDLARLWVGNVAADAGIADAAEP